MKRFHRPAIDPRYWLAITFASIFGTNFGDFYAHESGLGIVPGIAILAALAAAVFLVERRDPAPREAYYWLVILIIRTGATNIADYLAYQARVPGPALSLGLAALLAALAWQSSRASKVADADGRLPDTGAAYWGAMLTAGVFGTVVGDISQHVVGQGPAAIALDILLAIVLLAWRAGGKTFGLYWLVIAVARTAGTAMGDWLAENETLDIGLTIATLITGIIFFAILIVRRSRTREVAPANAA